MAGLGVAAEEARRPLLDEQVVSMVGEERPDRPVYMAGDPRTPFTPTPSSLRRRQVRWSQRGTIVYTRVRVCAEVRLRAQRMEAAKGKMRGFKKWTVILACGLYRILEPKHLPQYMCACVHVRTHTRISAIHG